MQNILSGTGFRSSSILRRGALPVNRLVRAFAVAKQDDDKVVSFAQLGLKDDIVNALTGQS
jgi:hypothetical protein